MDNTVKLSIRHSMKAAIMLWMKPKQQPARYGSSPAPKRLRCQSRRLYGPPIRPA